MKKSAFTLAEVLITLGIIGVVAALTLPNLIANYRNKVYVEQLKKSVSVLEQGFEKMRADSGVDRMSETQVWQSMTSSCESINIKAERCNNFLDNLKKYYNLELGPFKGIQDTYLNSSVVHHSPNPNSSLVFTDGSMLYQFVFNKDSRDESKANCKKIKSYGGSMCTYLGYVYIDVNGFKKPNKLGRDRFSFSLSDEGKLYPSFGTDYATWISKQPLSSNSYYWRNNSGYCGTPGTFDAVKISQGYGCSARIIENGWVMDY